MSRFGVVLVGQERAGLARAPAGVQFPERPAVFVVIMVLLWYCLAMQPPAIAAVHRVDVSFWCCFGWPRAGGARSCPSRGSIPGTARVDDVSFWCCFGWPRGVQFLERPAWMMSRFGVVLVGQEEAELARAPEGVKFPERPAWMSRFGVVLVGQE